MISDENDTDFNSQQLAIPLDGGEVGHTSAQDFNSQSLANVCAFSSHEEALGAADAGQAAFSSHNSQSPPDMQQWREAFSALTLLEQRAISAGIIDDSLQNMMHQAQNLLLARVAQRHLGSGTEPQ